MSFTVNTCFRSTRSDLSMFQWVMLSVICQSFFFFCLAPGHKKMFLLLFLLKRQSHRGVGCSTYLSTFPNGHTISQLGFCYILGSFLISVRVYAKAHYCACGCAIFPVLFVEKINMIPLICLCTFVKKSIGQICVGIFLGFLLCLIDLCRLLCQYAVLVTVAF